MRKLMKRMTALILAMAMSLSLLSVNVWAAELEPLEDGSVPAQISEEAANEKSTTDDDVVADEAPSGEESVPDISEEDVKMEESEVHSPESQRNSEIDSTAVLEPMSADSEKPVIDTSSIKMSSSTGTTGDTIKISVKITDNVGVKRAVVSFQNVETAKLMSYEKMLYNENTGLFEYEFKITDETANGHWYLSEIQGYDLSDNVDVISCGINARISDDSVTVTRYGDIQCVFTVADEGKDVHRWKSGIVSSLPTCTKKGERTFTCVICEKEKTEEIDTDPSNHTGRTEVRDGRAATCGEAGYSGDTYCLDCGKRIADGQVISATGKHTWNSGEVTKAPTCRDKGMMTYTCITCNETKTKETDIDPSNHTGETEVKNAKTATCGVAGYTGDTCCKDCGEKLADGKVIPATGKHIWNSGTVTKAATCKEKGEKTYTCTVCKETKTEAIDIDPSNHTGDTERRNSKPATCSAEGYTGDTYCLSCGAKLSSGQSIPATGNHTWGEGEVTKEPTFTEEGEKTYTCTVCGEQKTEVLEKLTQIELQDTDVNLSFDAVTYNAEEQTPAVTVISNEVELTEDVDYTVAYANNTNPGTGTVTVTGIGHYTGTVSKTFTINKPNASITAKNFTKTYSTKKQTFSLGAKAEGGAKLTYKSDNKSVAVDKNGKVTVKAKFVGQAAITITAAATKNYNKTTKKVTVTVNPTATTLSSAKNAKGLKMTVKWKKNTVGTGYQVQYSTDKSFEEDSKTINISKNKTTSKTITKLTKGKTYYVRIRTCKTVSKKNYYSGWSKVKTVKITK